MKEMSDSFNQSPKCDIRDHTLQQNMFQVKEMVPKSRILRK